MIRYSTRAIAIATAIIVPTALNAAGKSEILDKWYPALFAVDGEKLDELLAENAEIQLDDLGITQTKNEFLESLEEWSDSVQGAKFKWKIDPETKPDSSQATALVCYTFPENQILIREAFTFVDGRIANSHQMTAGEDCDGF